MTTETSFFMDMVYNLFDKEINIFKSEVEILISTCKEGLALFEGKQ